MSKTRKPSFEISAKLAVCVLVICRCLHAQLPYAYPIVRSCTTLGQVGWIVHLQHKFDTVLGCLSSLIAMILATAVARLAELQTAAVELSRETPPTEIRPDQIRLAIDRSGKRVLRVMGISPKQCADEAKLRTPHVEPECR